MKVLFRKSLAEENEFEICKKYFKVVESRLDCEYDLVIARYYALPYYLELEKDLAKRNCLLVNSYQQHK